MAERSEADGFLLLIERRITALKALADSYRAALAIGAMGQVGDADTSGVSASSGGRSEGPIDLPQGALLGKSLPAAVKLWLSSVRKKQTVREIANALREGGVESTSPNFENVVTGAIHRLKANNEVLRFKDGWGLAEFYPASLRSNLGREPKQPKRRNAKKARKTREPKTTEAASGSDDKTALMLGFITESKDGASISDIVGWLADQGIFISRDYVRVVTKRLRARGKIEIRDGSFYPLRAA